MRILTCDGKATNYFQSWRNYEIQAGKQLSLLLFFKTLSLTITTLQSIKGMLNKKYKTLQICQTSQHYCWVGLYSGNFGIETNLLQQILT